MRAPRLHRSASATGRGTGNSRNRQGQGKSSYEKGGKQDKPYDRDNKGNNDGRRGNRGKGSDSTLHSGGSVRGAAPADAPNNVPRRGVGAPLRFDITPQPGVAQDTRVGGRLQSFHHRWRTRFPDSSVP